MDISTCSCCDSSGESISARTCGAFLQHGNHETLLRNTIPPEATPKEDTTAPSAKAHPSKNVTPDSAQLPPTPPPHRLAGARVDQFTEVPQQIWLNLQHFGRKHVNLRKRPIQHVEVDVRCASTEDVKKTTRREEQRRGRKHCLHRVHVHNE